MAFQYLNRAEYDNVDVQDHFQTNDPYEIDISPEEESDVERLINEHTIVSLHDHPVQLPEDMNDYERYTKSGRVKLCYHGLARSPLDSVFVAPLGVKTWDDAINALGKMKCDIHQQDFVIETNSISDIQRAKEKEKVSIVYSLESASPIENKLDRLEVLYGMGLRSIGITYSESNGLGTGLADPFQGGLTNFGYEAVERMNKLGLLIDVSHASDQTTLDVCEASEAPVILSHNGARSLLDIERLDPDHVLKAVADTGGLIGIQAAPHTTATRRHPQHSIYSFMEHFEHVSDVVGIDHVTFGPDLNYGDHFSLHDYYSDYFSKNLDEFPDGIDVDIEHTEGMDNPNEAWTNIIRYLVHEGYPEDQISNVLGGNTLRVLRNVWT